MSVHMVLETLREASPVSQERAPRGIVLHKLRQMILFHVILRVQRVRVHLVRRSHTFVSQQLNTIHTP
jgi:hypothetical protein